MARALGAEYFLSLSLNQFLTCGKFKVHTPKYWFGFYVYMYTCMYIHARGRRQWSCAAILYSRVRVGTYVTSAALHVHVHVFEEHRSICTRTSAYIYM
jgi:hypothetical protein